MGKKILMLLQSEFPPDIRVEKEIKALSAEGFQVVLLCNRFSKAEPKDFSYGRVIRPSVWFGNVLANKILNFPLVFNPKFFFFLLRNALKEKPDFIHAHDLPMLPFGVILKKIMRRPLIFDMHENYPAALKAYKKKNIVERIVKNYKLALLLENILIKMTNMIIVVTSENRNRLLAHGVPEDKIRIVSNTVDLEQFTFEKNEAVDLKNYKENFVLLYSGRVSLNRGLDTPIKALKFLIERIPTVKLVIIGTGPYLSALKILAAEEGVENFVDFLDWPGHEKIKSYIAMADICLIPQPSNDHADTTVPHKLFEYMSQKRPVLASDAKPLKRILQETKAGMFFKSNDPEDFARKVVEMKNSQTDFGEQGRKMVEEKYNWQNDAKVLIEIYKDLQGDE